MTPQQIQQVLDYYANILIYQYKGMPKAFQTVQLYVNQAVCDGLFFLIQAAFNLNTAVGAQLTIIGQIIGVPRQVYGIAPYAVYFSFTRANGEPASIGFNRATTPVDPDNILRAQVQNTYTLTDFEMLNLIKLKIIYNNVFSSFSQLKIALYNTFAGGIDIVAPDTDMTYFNFTRAYKISPASVGFNRASTYIDPDNIFRTQNFNWLMQINYTVSQPYYTVVQIAQFLNIMPHSCGVGVTVEQI